ncbi:MAG: SIR2 family protein [Deltaproteobacteria bacterium HGW-Deltaproteobacteria-13]|jgi:tetratricopeptide (TPR) repeat protein|nr:MAG: SIR2 family protein [Deltaproteobacteria bacterium HGW-Deltaproteobacteria-13]
MKEITLKKFIAHFSENLRKEKRFCFILGAGASKTSGIPTGAELVQQWIKELKEADEEDLNKWLKEKSIKDDDYASHYSTIFDKRFEFSKKDGFAFLEKIMEGIEPSCGYSFLAQILATGKHNIVITTNFDSLTEDALFIYTQKKPLVIGHSLLADYISTNLSRPLIIKIHNDLFLSPKNGVKDVDCLDDNFSKNLKDIFKYYTPLVIGYGGNDGSLMKFLEKLDHIEEGIYWFYINGEKRKSCIIDFVAEADGHFVQIKGFDDLMIQLGDKLELQKLDTEIENIAKKRADNYRKQIEDITTKKGKADSKTKEAMTSITSRGEITWWNYALLAIEEPDINKANEIFLQGIEKFQKSAALLTLYANFLSKKRKDEDEAEKYYLKALELDPNDANFNNDYAVFLHNNRKDYYKAEKYYLKALELDPKNIITMGNYASFLYQIRNNYDEAEKYFLKTLELDPLKISSYGNYASFLYSIRKDFNKAEKYFLKALELNPEYPSGNGNYAVLLCDIKKQYDMAEKYFLKALEIEPENANLYGNYAKFLIIRNRRPEAIKFINKAFELNKNYENSLALELYFYSYSIFPQLYPESKTKIEELLNKGIKSIGWRLTEITEIAHKENHPDYQQLIEFEKRITQI